MSTPQGLSNRREQSRRSQKAVYAMAAVLLVLAGCAIEPTLGMVDWQHGARRGEVASSYSPDLSAAQLPKCLADLPRDQYMANRYVKIQYRHVRLMRSAVAPVPPALDIKDGDVVELWPADCAAGSIARITRILSTKGQ